MIGNLNPESLPLRPEHTSKRIGSLLYPWPQILCLYLLLFLPKQGIASDPPHEEKPGQSSTVITVNPDDKEIENKVAPEDGSNKADTIHAALSSSFSASVHWVDSFFRERETVVEEENSTLRLRFSGFLETGKGVDFQVKAKGRLVLPNFENKLHLFASSILEGDEQGIDYFDPGNEEDRERNFYLSGRYFLKAVERRSLSLSAGLKFHSSTPALFAGPRYRYTKEWSTWNFRFIEEFLYFTDIGWESKTSLDFEIPLSKSFIYRIELGGEWNENERGYRYLMDYDLYHTLSENKAIKYRVRYVYNTRPENHLEYALAGVRYRQQFWRKWLFFEIAPQVAFRLEDDYDPKPGITLSLEVLLGKDYMNHARKPLE